MKVTPWKMSRKFSEALLCGETIPYMKRKKGRPVAYLNGIRMVLPSGPNYRFKIELLRDGDVVAWIETEQSFCGREGDTISVTGVDIRLPVEVNGV